jgi:hypothetical protein
VIIDASDLLFDMQREGSDASIGISKHVEVILNEFEQWSNNGENPHQVNTLRNPKIRNSTKRILPYRMLL